MNNDFELKFIKGYRLTTIEVIYYVPDYNSLVQEFLWQTMDIPPQFQRMHKFLNYWKSNVNAIIKEINVAYNQDIYSNKLKNVSHIFKM